MLLAITFSTNSPYIYVAREVFAHTSTQCASSSGSARPRTYMQRRRHHLLPLSRRLPRSSPFPPRYEIICVTKVFP
jgi:hypothetical protein